MNAEHSQQELEMETLEADRLAEEQQDEDGEGLGLPAWVASLCRGCVASSHRLCPARGGSSLVLSPLDVSWVVKFGP